jgi:hypothetical protein
MEFEFELRTFAFILNFFFDKYDKISLKSAEGRNPSTQEVYKDNTPLKIKRRTQLCKLFHARYLGDV